ncbi:hypothetical protein BC829DRAFT_399940, partial [Chytridium lagenaria]
IHRAGRNLPHRNSNMKQFGDGSCDMRAPLENDFLQTEPTLDMDYHDVLPSLKIDTDEPYEAMCEPSEGVCTIPYSRKKSVNSNVSDGLYSDINQRDHKRTLTNTSPTACEDFSGSLNSSSNLSSDVSSNARSLMNLQTTRQRYRTLLAVVNTLALNGFVEENEAISCAETEYEFVISVLDLVFTDRNFSSKKQLTDDQSGSSVTFITSDPQTSDGDLAAAAPVQCESLGNGELYLDAGTQTSSHISHQKSVSDFNIDQDAVGTSFNIYGVSDPSCTRLSIDEYYESSATVLALYEQMEKRIPGYKRPKKTARPVPAVLKYTSADDNVGCIPAPDIPQDISKIIEDNNITAVVEDDLVETALDPVNFAPQEALHSSPDVTEIVGVVQDDKNCEKKKKKKGKLGRWAEKCKKNVRRAIQAFTEGFFEGMRDGMKNGMRDVWVSR